MPGPFSDIDDKPDDDLWTRRIKAFWNGLFKIVQVLTPLLVALTLYLQSRTNTKVDQAADQVTKVAASAANHAAKAAEATKEVKTELDQNRKERQEQFEDIKQGQVADLKNWQAYHSKEPEDMNKAQAALNKVIGEGKQ